MLDAGIVDEDVDGAEFLLGVGDHGGDLVGLAHVGGGIAHRDAVLLGEAGAQRLDLAGVAEAVEDDIGAVGGKRPRRSRGRCRWSSR